MEKKKRDENFDFHKSLKLYKFMRIRMKISYYAW